ncbi:hypothetical protein PRNP1_000781 [Phytophthora ramorum]
MPSDSEEDAFDDASAAGSPPTDDGDATRSAEDDAVSLLRGGPFLEEMEGVATQVAELEELECCSKRCFTGKRDAMIYFFLSLTRMTKNERQVSLLSVLKLLIKSTITREKSGFVESKETPASKGVWIRLHKDKELKTQSLADFLSAWSVVPKANDKPLNPEKVSDIYSKVLPFVPSQFTDDPIYMKPSARMIETAQEIKRSRRSKADKKRREREEVGVSVDDDEGKEAVV